MIARRSAAALGGLIAALSIGAVVSLSVADAGGAGANAGDQRAAQLEAARALAELTLPAGAVRSATDPSGGALTAAALAPSTPRLIDRHEFSRVPGSPQAVVAWVGTHRPAGTQVTATGSGSGPHGALELTQLSFTRVDAGVESSALVVAATSLRSGWSAVRVDVQAVWLLVRPAWATVPSQVRAATIIVQRLGGLPGRPVAVTAPAEVRRIARLVNRLPVSQRDGAAISCPVDRGPIVRVAFYRRSGDRTPVAVATADGSGCGMVALKVHGRTAPALAGGPRLIRALGRLIRTS